MQQRVPTRRACRETIPQTFVRPAVGGGRRVGPGPGLCNHRHGAPHPSGFVDERDGVSYAFIAISSTSTSDSSSCKRWHMLAAAGEKIYIFYIAVKSDPLTTFLDLGFVPPELLPQQPGHRGG